MNLQLHIVTTAIVSLKCDGKSTIRALIQMLSALNMIPREDQRQSIQVKSRKIAQLPQFTKLEELQDPNDPNIVSLKLNVEHNGKFSSGYTQIKNNIEQVAKYLVENQFVESLQKIDAIKDLEIREHMRRIIEKVKTQKGLIEQSKKRIKDDKQKLKQLSECNKLFESGIQARSTGIMSEVFEETESLISYLNTRPEIGNRLKLQLETANKRKVSSLRSLYRYSESDYNFHYEVDGLNNIMLLCLTVEQKLLGVFSGAAIERHVNKQSPKKPAFLFYFGPNKNINCFPLRDSRRVAYQYDQNNIVFGREEICIGNNSDILQSHIPNAKVANERLWFVFDLNRPELRKKFLSQTERCDKIKLKNYEFVQVIFQEA